MTVKGTIVDTSRELKKMVFESYHVILADLAAKLKIIIKSVLNFLKQWLMAIVGCLRLRRKCLESIKTIKESSLKNLNGYASISS